MKTQFFAAKKPLSLVIAVFFRASSWCIFLEFAHGGRTAGQVVNDVDPLEFAPVGNDDECKGNYPN